MYIVSEELKDILNTSSAIISTARLTFSDPQLVIDGDNLYSLNIKDYCYNEGRIIGTNIARDVEVEIKNNNFDLQDKEFYLEIGIQLSNGAYEYIPYGYFIVDNIEDVKSSNKLKLKAMDRMIKLNKTFEEFNDEEYPMTLKEFTKKFANQYEIDILEQELPNEDFVINTRPYFTGKTGREVLRNIAEMYGKFAKFDRNGVLGFYLVNETDETITRDKMNSTLEIDKESGEINVVSLTLSDEVDGENVTMRDEESIEIYGENIFRITDNSFVSTQETRERAIEAIFNAVKGFKYVPTSFSYMGRPYLDCGDTIKVQNMDNDGYVESIVLNNYIVVPNLRQSKLENKALTNTEVKLQFTPEMKRIELQTELKVNKVNGKIDAYIEKQTEIDGNIQSQISNITQTVNEISSSVKLLGGNNLQQNSIGAYGTKDYEQNETGTIIATEEELLKSETDNGFGRIIYLSNNKWFKFRSEQLKIGDTYTLSFKYNNTENNHCVIKLNNNSEIILVDTLEEEYLDKVTYTFEANTEYVELEVIAGDGKMGITDYYLQVGTEATRWQPASGEALSTSLEIYYNGIKVKSDTSEIITDISNQGFTVENVNGKILITFNKDKCILSDTEINGILEQNGWRRYNQKIDYDDILLEVKV